MVGKIPLLFNSLFLVAMLCMPSARAQYTSASFGEIVVDASTSVVPDAAVTLRNVDTGMTKVIRTSTDGSFLFPGVPVGEYRLAVEKAGFSTYIREGIRLTVGQTATLTVNLEVGETAEQVTVLGDVNAINTREATLAGC